MQAPQTKLVSYIRVSTKKQGDSGLGLEAQQATIERYRASVSGVVVQEYREIESGKKDDRPELAKALAHAKRIRGTLVIAKLDRLARSVYFVAGLMQSGTPFVVAEYPNDSPFITHIRASVDEDERKKISDRTKAALTALKARGKKLGGYRENAYKLTGGANPKASKRAGEVASENADIAYADIAPFIHQLRVEGLTLAAIADRLNLEGHTTRRGVGWNKVQVSRVLGRSEAE